MQPTDPTTIGSQRATARRFAVEQGLDPNDPGTARLANALHGMRPPVHPSIAAEQADQIRATEGSTRRRLGTDHLPGDEPDPCPVCDKVPQWKWVNGVRGLHCNCSDELAMDRHEGN